MTEGFLGAVASSAGDDFHELWSLQQLLAVLKPDSAVQRVKIEGVPANERHTELGEHAQAVDVTVEQRIDGQVSFHYAQLKYSPSQPDLSWSWSRLLSSKISTKPDKGVLGKLAQMLKAVSFSGSFSIVTNQPLSQEVADDVARLIVNRDAQSDEDGELLARLKKGTGLDEADLIAVLQRWDLSAFGTVPRLIIETNIMQALADTIDADARSDMMVLQQRAADLVLPENRNFGPVNREKLLIWLGAGAKEILEPAPSRLHPPEPYLPRTQTSDLVQRLVTGSQRPLRICADGGCGKTSLVLKLGDELPTGSEMVVYDCYGGGLFLSSDDRRHLPEHAFVQVGNELAFRLGTPFVIQKSNSAKPIEAFLRRVRAAAYLIAQRASDALLVLCFDAADNSRLGANHWKESCFLDELLAVSGWPDNVRIVLTCRNSRAGEVGANSAFDTFELPAFEVDEVEALLGLHNLRWGRGAVVEIHGLSTGIPRRVAYAIEGLGAGQSEEAIQRLLPRGVGIDPLFEKLAKEAGARLGDEGPIWALLCILARCPRPIPAPILEKLSGLPTGGLRDVAADLGGIVEHQAGWSFQDEDFEHFADGRTAAIAADLMARAAATLFDLRKADRYAAISLGEILMATGRIDQLYDLVQTPDEGLEILSKTEQWLIHARRLALGLRCCAQGQDVTGACDLLIASAEAAVRDQLFAEMIRDNLDLAAKIVPDLTFELMLTNRSFRKFRASCRIELAASLADTEAGKAREHLRWWREELRGAPNAKHGQGCNGSDLAAEFLTQMKLNGIEAAVAKLLRWKPWNARLSAVQRVLERGSICLADLETAIGLRVWPPDVLAPMIAAALLSGAKVQDGWVAKAIERLGRMRSTRWLRRERFDLSRSGLFVGQEAALLICETALPFCEFHPSLRGILEAAFPSPPLESPADWRNLRSAAALHMRVLALWSALGDGDVELETWLPPPREVVGVRIGKAGLEEDSEEDHGRWDEDREWNKDRVDALAELGPMWSAASRFCQAASDGEQQTLIVDIARSMKRSPYHSYNASTDQGYLLMRGALFASICRGSESTPLLEEVWQIIREHYDNRLEIMLELTARLAMNPAAADLVAERLVEIEAYIEKVRAKASVRAALLMRCARISLQIDMELARHFFDRAVVAVEKVDFEAVSVLDLAMSVAHQGIAGSSVERRAVAVELGNLVGALDVSLGLRHDLPYGRVAGAIAAMDVPISLTALSQWHDRGVLAPNYVLHEVLDTKPAMALTSAQRVALCIACDMFDSMSIELARKPGGLPDHAHDWLIDYAMKEADLAAVTTEFAARGKTAEDSLAAAEAAELGQRIREWSQKGGGAGVAAPQTSMIRSHAELGQALQALQALGSDVSKHDVDALMRRVNGPTLRTPLLDALKKDENCAHLLLAVLPAALARWSPYPPVSTWIEKGVPELIFENLARLSSYEGEYIALKAALDLLDLSAADRSALVLKAIARNAEKLGAHQIFSLAGQVVAGVNPERRTALLVDLIRRVQGKAELAAAFDLGELAVPEDAQKAVASLIYALLGDPDKAVRWRASHAVRLLAVCRDPVLLDFVAQLAQPTAGSFVIEPFYVCAAQQQLLLALERAAIESPEAIAPFATAILAHLRSSTHLVLREHGRALLLHLQDQDAISLAPDDLAFLKALNRPRSLPAVANERSRYRSRPRSERPERNFIFDDTDTVPYWYATPAGHLNLDMEAFLDRVEAVIHGRWGYTSTMNQWLQEPRLDRLGDHRTDRSHRHGAQPSIEDLRRHLEWHGMLCAVGKMIETMPVYHTGGADPDFADWLRRLRHTADPYWLSDLRSSAPFEPRFWGYAKAAPGAGPVSPDALPKWIFERELKGEAGITVAGDYSLLDGESVLTVDIRSALVSPETAAALAHALGTATDHMDFLLPGGDHGEAIEEPGFQLLPWLRIRHLDAGTDRPDPFRGAVSGVPLKPLIRSGASALTGDPTGMTWRDSSGEVALRSIWWGDPERNRPSHGWRTSASESYLASMLEERQMSMIFSVELTPREDGEKLKRQWRMFVLNGSGEIECFDGRPGHLGPVLLRQQGMTQTTDTFGRWLLHRIGDLAERRTAQPASSHAAIKMEMRSLCDRFKRHRQDQRW